MDKKKPKDQKLVKPATLNHVGGVTADAGGIDPAVDENLIRLSGGP